MVVATWAAPLQRLNAFGVGQLSWSCAGETIATIGYEMKADNMLLSFRYRCYEEEWTPVEQRIDLTTQACRYGGERKWFLCPNCQRRCGVLVQASVDFVCRLCANLPYACQNETRYDRLARKHRKLRARIFDESQQWVAKRKGMHWRTFNNLHHVYKKTDAACYEEIAKMYSNRLSTSPIGG